ncbi:hypothetical protein [Paludifilum halophilum]|uniref:Uncharacterized protein n=1 Tax=Paludifilum halophilum TaxID=1642702 RepID=A0A235BBQ3_9BACL|nr:hypothetical protein [Paludifilum halophilum]OYD09731.1 hypothetical protein CHM34_01670 [Paludifilum halophilum]
MKHRIYLSRDEGAAAFLFAAAEIFSEAEAWPAGKDLAQWGERIGISCFIPGQIWAAGIDSQGIHIYFSGFRGEEAIFRRILFHIVKLAGDSPRDWDMVPVKIQAPGVVSWEQWIEYYPQLLRIYRERK